MKNQSGLYGIVNSNRKPDEHWGKNCFNSSFPTALASYMLENDIQAVYIRLEEQAGKLKVVADTIPIRDVFNCETNSAENLEFDFESVYLPYQQYSYEPVDSIDLVVRNINGDYLSPMEVKLTVLPTDQTSRKPENQWGCELVIRSATTSYCALGMFHAIKNEAQVIRDIFENVCASIQSWDNNSEVTSNMRRIVSCLDRFELKFHRFQKPLVMQTIWKTQGKSPLLAEKAFDVVVWSDYAFSRLFVDQGNDDPHKMSRPMRATARLARCLWELSKSGKIRHSDIYRRMSFDLQTDKELSIAGDRWRSYVTSDRVITPMLPRNIVRRIINQDHIEKLSPERRFDQTLYYYYRNNEDE